MYQPGTGSQWSRICACPPAATLGTGVLAPDPPGSRARVLVRWFHRCLAEPEALPVYGAAIAPYPEDRS